MFITYCVHGESRSSLLIESSDSMIVTSASQHFLFRCILKLFVIFAYIVSHNFLILLYNMFYYLLLVKNKTKLVSLTLQER